MTYAEYMKMRLNGEISAGISNSEAIRLIMHLPTRFRYAHLLWTWIWTLSIPGSICVSIFYRWWVGLLLLFIVTPMIYRAIGTSAAQFILEHAEKDEQFFSFLVDKNLLVFKSTRTR